MPIQIDQARARDLAPYVDEALELLVNEFKGLDAHQQYRNAFARLLKPDPLGRVLMMGTDQRDMFVSELRRVIAAHVSRDGHIVDFGAGDGQTFSLVAASVPEGTRVSIEDPNPEYVADYSAFLGTQGHLRQGVALVSGFDEIDAAAKRKGALLPQDGSIDLGLAIHMIYFLADLPVGLTRMVRFLRPGGALFVVFADETKAYTGVVLKRFIETKGGNGSDARKLSAIPERNRQLASPGEGGGAILEVLRAADIPADLEAQSQPSRLYGHTLADVIALSTIAEIGYAVELAKAAAALLHDEPEAVDLRIEDDGPRKGMWSVAQPQRIAVIRRGR